MSYQGGMYTGVFHNLFRKPVNAQSQKEYKTKIDTLKGIDGKLDRELETLKKLMMDHSKKLTSVDNFVKNWNIHSLKEMKAEFQSLKQLFREDEREEHEEERANLNLIESMNRIVKAEESFDLRETENSVKEDLMVLKELLHKLEPIWKAQLKFINLSDELILENKESIKELIAILREEDKIFELEDELLKKIKTKVHTMERKTNVKMKDDKEYKNHDTHYTNVKYMQG